MVITKKNMNKHTAKQVCEMLTISQTTLSNYTVGGQVKRNGRVEWGMPAILAESDYERVIENGRAKLYYFDSAIEKIRDKREKKEAPNPS
jgi:hypothetical protein